MNISQAAVACGLPSKTIRYYEDQGLVVPGRHAGNDYRVYSLQDIDHLRFLQRARVAGFSLEQCAELLAFYVNPASRREEVKPLLLEKVQQVDQQLIALNALRQALVQMADDCSHQVMGDDIGVSSSTRNKTYAPMPFTLVELPSE